VKWGIFTCWMSRGRRGTQAAARSSAPPGLDAGGSSASLSCSWGSCGKSDTSSRGGMAVRRRCELGGGQRPALEDVGLRDGMTVPHDLILATSRIK
jgi:hypothetical protein